MEYSKENNMIAIKANLNGWIREGITIDELKTIVRELEREQTDPRKGGRPLGIKNGGSHLLDNIALIRERLHDKDKRGDIAASFEVSRQTLNEFIRLNLPEYHKPKNESL